MANWIKVFESPNVYRAEMLKNELLNKEIAAVVLNKKDRNYLLGWCEVHVQEYQEEAAKEIIDIFNQNDEETKPTI
ncbi:putative signal transducing protein [Emticicia sp. TH156]|uniref:putative signal transducing protein n=1 Tax=Emticicia sp. TH156 TaxID=2067454 RepID=UPI000C773C12|nr:DUF2007 domain-containing protein [Emticicia sp. TH156]PLK43070.1 hypothetical protein C0V77_16940 [Emticicia sp. TH156]